MFLTSDSANYLRLPVTTGSTGFSGILIDASLSSSSLISSMGAVKGTLAGATYLGALSSSESLSSKALKALLPATVPAPLFLPTGIGLDMTISCATTSVVSLLERVSLGLNSSGSESSPS